MSLPNYHRFFRFVRHCDADAYCQLGWSPSRALVGTYYEQYSVLFEWLCDCPIPQLKEGINE